MPNCDEKVKHGRCMFEAIAGSTKCKVHHRCTLCGEKHADVAKRSRCESCGRHVCIGMTAGSDGIFRGAKAHKRLGTWCGPVVEA